MKQKNKRIHTINKKHVHKEKKKKKTHEKRGETVITTSIYNKMNTMFSITK